MVAQLCVYIFQFVGVEGFITFLTDMYPTVFRRGYRREILIGVVCGICFLIGLSMVTEVRTPLTLASFIPSELLAHLQLYVTGSFLLSFLSLERCFITLGISQLSF